MGLMDSDAEEPQSKLLRWIVTGALAVVGLSLLSWYLLRFQTEKKTVDRFFQALAAGNTDEAYRIWQPSPSYSKQDFLTDWGPQGELGPVKEFRVVAAMSPGRSGSGVAPSGVIVVVEVYPPSGARGEPKEVRLWVQRSDQSISFPP
jgi:hypothetical protein